MNIELLLEEFLPKDRIKCRLIDLVAYASDAGFYYLRPKAVVRPVSEREIIQLFEFSHKHRIPLTFRTGGTSLSGQSITDGILVDLKQYWEDIHMEDNGLHVRVQPGARGAMVNTYLKKYKRKIGPDPSSIDSAMMGGILSNNSSGMCCGVHLNSYHTTKHIRFILPSGLVFSTENREDYVRFETECPQLFNSLKGLREQMHSFPGLADRVRTKYLTKNTVGYSLNAFLDYEHPLDIFSHLLIGAEGTLGFISEAVLETVPDYPYKSTAFIYFEDIYSACQAIRPLTASGAEAVELMDRASLRSIEDFKGVPAILKTLPPTAAALLVEYQGYSGEDIAAKIAELMPHTENFKLLEPITFTEDPIEQAFLWKLRKGMFPAVGAVRASGTTVILEDIAFPVAQLGDAILDLHFLFEKYEYDNAIIFGHAKDGNIHFVVTQSFNSPEEVDRYDRFLREVVDLTVNKYDGTLKAEHGTGRNMSPFVETEWGPEAYAIMKSLKEITDPTNLLNPGVIINENKNAHLLDLKALPSVEQEVDRCIECGYCEYKCPSRNITLTPRQRIVVRRELAILANQRNATDHATLLDQYQYDGLDTCAVDGMCATSCPVDINTGDLVKRLRRENHSRFANNTALFVGRNFKSVTQAVNIALALGTAANKVFGKNFMNGFTKVVRKVIPAFPLWSNQIIRTGKIHYPVKENGQGSGTGSTSSIQDLEDAGSNRSILLPEGAASTTSIPLPEGATSTTSIPLSEVAGGGSTPSTVVYFPSCISRMMGGVPGKANIPDTFFSVSRKAGIRVLVPDAISGMCCGQIFSSKGFNPAFEQKSNETVDHLWEITDHGRHPVILDVTSCTHTLQQCRPVLTETNRERYDKLTILDSIDYLHDIVMPAVGQVVKKGAIAVHPVCSLYKMGLERKFLAVASHFSAEVKVPAHTGCCGMAGDRGFLFPELTASATAPQARDLIGRDLDGYYSSGKTCEIAMSEAVGKNYEGLLYLVDEAL